MSEYKFSKEEKEILDAFELTFRAFRNGLFLIL